MILLHPLFAVAIFNPEVLRGHVLFGLLLRCRTGGQVPHDPALKLRRLGHPLERRLLVLQLATLLPGLTPSTGRPVDHADRGVAAILVLTSWTTGSEVLDLTVMDRHRQHPGPAHSV